MDEVLDVYKRQAQSMLGRTPGNIVAIRPLREGVISDYEMTERMIKEFIRKVLGFRLFKPNVVMCVPSVITEVEERAVIDAGTQAGAKRVFLVEEPVADRIWTVWNWLLRKKCVLSG